ncbi:DNA primase [Flexivirga alba]|uniref:DNA primase n=1 Tax=Flexivirga alba TaxID=702742 RepID=A0ABW2AKU8_9MICO
MAGRIKSEDVELVKERSSIEDVVSEHVTLRRSGSNLVGLCPFHDEKTPSFSVNPTQGFYHCFGCQKGGDVLSFVQEVDHLSFAEAVERLAGKVGVELHYEDGVRPREESIGRRTRLLEAHRVAAEFYASLLPETPEARTARDYLRGREFDGAIAEQFGLGYAPTDGHALSKVLRDKGFNRDEMLAAGLINRGGYDVFQGRLLWPIRDITGDTVGFGARRIFDGDPRPAKYLNTGETAIYKKQRVLYGLDLAKKSIADDRRAVVVEGYTDVMAAHLSGVTQAVATCGTAFGVEHIKLLRRLLRDERGETRPRSSSPSTETRPVRRLRSRRMTRTSAGHPSPSSRSRRTGRTRASCGSPPGRTRSGSSSTARRRCSSSSYAPRWRASTWTPSVAGSLRRVRWHRSLPTYVTHSVGRN